MECQVELLKKRTIIFQGKKMNLEELFGPHMGEDYKAALHGDFLERFVRGEMINVASKLLRTEESAESCYVNRTLRREGEALTETDILHERQKIVLITGGAGSGKSVLLAKLAAVVKRENPHLWVVYTRMRDCTVTLKDCQMRDGEEILLEELIGIRETSLFDQSIFQRRSSVVLMLDGVDEAFPDYERLVLRLLAKCRDAHYISRLVLTARPHLTERLNNVPQIAMFTLQPLRRNDVIEFLVAHWMHRLGLREEDRENCVIYATELLRQVSPSDLDKHLVGTALGAKLLAELFERSDRNDESVEWEGCREYLDANRAKPKLSQKRVTRLFQRFVEEIRKVFMDRANPSGSTLASQMFNRIYDECVVCHQTLAVNKIVDASNRRLFPESQQLDGNLEATMLEIGFVHKVNNKLCFAYEKLDEYFFIERLLKRLQQLPLRFGNRNNEFQKYFLEEVLSEGKYFGVRAFLNEILKGSVDSLRVNSRQTHSLSSSLVHQLAKEGYEVILQFVFKYMNSQTQVNIKDNLGRTVLHYAAEGSHLDTVKYLVEQGADVNIRNNYCVTALHYATLEGHLDTVKFLVERGANVNIVSKNNGTPLQCAAVVGRLDAVKFLVERGADVNIRNNCNMTALHYATAEGHLDIVKFLVDQGVDVNVKSDSNQAAIHYAAEKGHLYAVRFLAERGADVNITGVNNWTALYFAAMGGHLDTVKWLVERGAYMNVIDSFNRTALHYASEKGHADIVKFLLDHTS